MRTYLVTGGAGFIGSNYSNYMFALHMQEISRILRISRIEIIIHL